MARFTVVARTPDDVEASMNLPEFQARSRQQATEWLHVLGEIASGTFTSETVALAYGKDGELSQRWVTTTKPTAKDRLTAIADLVRYGRIPVGPPKSELIGKATLDPRALFAALADPAVRKYLETSYPELSQQLKLLAAEAIPEVIVAEEP